MRPLTRIKAPSPWNLSDLSVARRLLQALPVAGVQGAAEFCPLPAAALPQRRSQPQQGKRRQPKPGAARHASRPRPSTLSGVVSRLLQGKYILTPCPISYAEEQLLHFFGQLLGIAIRADVPLPLDLLGSFWKGLVGDPLDPEQDLQEADVLTYNYVKKFENVSGLPCCASLQQDRSSCSLLRRRR